PYDPIVAIRMDAFACAMRAKINDLPSQDVDLLMTRAEEALNSDAPLFRAITSFVVQYEEVRFNREALAQIGDALSNAVQLISLPDPVDAGRRDIYG
ncbi:MAG: hypothetical protein ACPG61_18185, partial [Paracoccaceae bacterium]